MGTLVALATPRTVLGGCQFSPRRTSRRLGEGLACNALFGLVYEQAFGATAWVTCRHAEPYSPPVAMEPFRRESAPKNPHAPKSQRKEVARESTFAWVLT